MSAITELRVDVARTINLGNFESMRIEAGITVAVAEGDDIEAVKATIQPELRALLEDTWRAQHRKREENGAQP
jgi:hypothetical protein